MHFPKMTFVLAAAVMTLTFFALSVKAHGDGSGVLIKNDLPCPIYATNTPPAFAREPEMIPLQPGEAALFPWSYKLEGTSVKVSKVPNCHEGHFALEYTIDEPTELWINLSDIDGAAPGVAAQTFADAYVHTYAEGGNWVCEAPVLDCPPGGACVKAYQWDHDDTKITTCSKRPERWVIEFNNP